jgi:hypothetical protein
MKRPSDAEVENLLDEDAESGGVGYTEIVKELYRARSAEREQLKRNARLLKTVLKLWYCAHDEGSFCGCRKMADATLRSEGVVL